MNTSNTWRIVVLVTLILLAQLQIAINSTSKPNPIKYLASESPDFEFDDFPYDLPFPIINETAPESKVKEAEKFLNLPTWSKGYLNCNDQNSEVSCFEVVRAAETIENYENIIKKGGAKGQIYVDAKKFKPEDRMTMLYQAFQIGIATNREVYFDHSLLPFYLPFTVKDSKGKVSGKELLTDYQFGCANVDKKFQKLLIKNVTWPQALYTHHIVAPFLRQKFSFHAAYFIGNYLFGTEDAPEKKCMLENGAKYAVEAHVFNNNNYLPRPMDFQWLIARCGVTDNAFIVSNNEVSNTENSIFKDKSYVTGDEEELDGFLCSLRKMMSAERVIFTFGSRYGFWGAALQGRKGGFVNTIDRLCINTTNSQSGSLFHTYCPDDKTDIFRTNNRMFVCGPNVNDVRLYFDYLLW